MKLQHAFSINHTSDVDGETYFGTFTTKKLSILDKSKLKVRTIQLCGGMHYDDDKPGVGVDAETWYINHMIATIEVSLVTKPEWFKIDQLVDMDLLALVYGEVSNFENTFRGRVNANTSSTSGSPAPDAQANGSRATRAVVDDQIRVALES